MNLNRFRLERILRISPRHEAGRRHLATAPRADGPCLASCLISNKLPVVIRGPAASRTKQFPFADEWDNAGEHSSWTITSQAASACATHCFALTESIVVITAALDTSQQVMFCFIATCSSYTIALFNACTPPLTWRCTRLPPVGCCYTAC